VKRDRGGRARVMEGVRSPVTGRKTYLGSFRPELNYSYQGNYKKSLPGSLRRGSCRPYTRLSTQYCLWSRAQALWLALRSRMFAFLGQAPSFRDLFMWGLQLRPSSVPLLQPPYWGAWGLETRGGILEGTSPTLTTQ